MSKALLAFLLLLPISLVAQTGGKTSFDFLNVPDNARLAALGGVNVSLSDRDINFFHSNPALAGDTLDGMASAGYQFFVADIGQATFSYAHPFEKIGTLLFGVQHIGYGDIQGFDASGHETAMFNASETALVVGKSHAIGNFRMGANIRAVFSNIAGYRASVVMVDIGGVFIHPEHDLRVGLVVKNLGGVLSDYSDTKSSLPFDVRLGVTFKPEHMPFRFSITGYNLKSRSVTYDDPADEEEEPATLNKILRRVNFGAELLLHRNVNIMVGYNYRTHQELKLTNGGAGAGISAGFSARIKAVELVFSRGGYVAGKAGYSFTLSTNVNKLLMRR